MGHSPENIQAVSPIRWHFPPRSSTRAFIREARRTRGYSLADWLHGYVYARWPYLYIGIGTGEHPLAPAVKGLIAWVGGLPKPRAVWRWLSGNPTSPGSIGEDRAAITCADTYHGKVVTLES